MIVNYNWQSPLMRNLDTEPATKLLLEYLNLYQYRLNSDFLFRLALEILMRKNDDPIYPYEFADKDLMIRSWAIGEAYWSDDRTEIEVDDGDFIKYCQRALREIRLFGFYSLAEVEIRPWGPNDFYNMVLRPTNEAIHFLNKLPRKYDMNLTHPELLAEIEYAKRKIADGKTTLSNK